MFCLPENCSTDSHCPASPSPRTWLCRPCISGASGLVESWCRHSSPGGRGRPTRNRTASTTGNWNSSLIKNLTRAKKSKLEYCTSTCFTDILAYLNQAFFSPILRHQQQQNFRNLEFRREILEFSKKILSFWCGNFWISLEFRRKILILGEKSLSLENFLSLDCLEFSEKWWKNKPVLKAF